MTNKWKKIVSAAVATIVVILVALAFYFGPGYVSGRYFDKGVSAFQSGDYSGAKSNFQKSLETGKDNSEANYYLAKIALGKSNSGGAVLYPEANYQEAASYIEAAIAGNLEQKNKNFYISALNDIGFAYAMMHNYEKADPYFQKVIEVSPENAFVARYFLATDYFNRRDKAQEALKVLIPAFKFPLNDFQRLQAFRSYSLLARLFLFTENYKSAEEASRVAIREGKEKAGELDVQIAHNVLATVLAHKGDFKGAEAEVKKAEELSGKSNSYACVLASVYETGKNYIKAIAVAKAMEPSSSYMYSLCLGALVNSYLAQKNKSAAVMYADQYIKLTNQLTDKNVFVLRYRENFSQVLTAK